MGKRRDPLMDRFVQGYACALSGIVSSHGYNTSIVEALENLGMTKRQMKAAGVDEFDLEKLQDVFRDVEKRRQRRLASEERACDGRLHT